MPIRSPECLSHPQGVELITKEAEGRRGFIDWGVYYSDPEFKELWWQYRKILKQRNALLRQEAGNSSQSSLRMTCHMTGHMRAMTTPCGKA